MYKGRKTVAIIAAGGSGARFGGKLPKQFFEFDGENALLRSISVFQERSDIDEIIAVVPEGYEGEVPAGVRAVIGGADRAASVRNGLDAVSFAEGLALVHDAARPFVSQDVIDRVLEAAEGAGAAVPVVPATDTLYETGERTRTLDRSKIFAAQTPQGFDLALIKEAHSRARETGVAATDDASLVLALGRDISFVPGSPANVKITTKADLDGRPAPMCQFRAGIGFDAHRFAAERPLILAGTQIPFEKGLLGHSDADVLTHAVMDAILGALKLGDIGRLFPDTDEQYKDISSIKLLAKVVEKMYAEGYEAENLDATLVCERPKIAPYAAQMEQNLADALHCAAKSISIKATTTEKLGFTGREEGIAAEAVILLKKR